MGIFEKFSIGVLRGMKYDELAVLLDDAPELLGRKIGGALDDLRSRGDNLIAQEDIELIERLIDVDESAEQELLGALIKSEIDRYEQDARLKIYLKALNLVADAVLNIRRPILIRGFLHCPDCWTYWKYQPQLAFGTAEPDHSNGRFTLNSSLVTGSTISPPSEFLRVEFLDDLAVDMAVEEIILAANVDIRKGKTKKLVNKLTRSSQELVTIEEFSFQKGLYSFANNDIEIPSDAPGISEMFRTLALALDAQDTPDKALFDSVAALGNDFAQGGT